MPHILYDTALVCVMRAERYKVHINFIVGDLVALNNIMRSGDGRD